MSAPRRWIDEGGSATPFERDLLRSALSVEPPPDAQKQVWAAVLAQLPAAAAAGAAGGAALAVKGVTKGTAAAVKGAGAAKMVVAAKAGVGSSGGATLAGAGLLKSALIGAGSAVALLATYSVVTPPDRTEPAGPTGAPVVAASAAAARPKAPGRLLRAAPAPEAVHAPDPVPAEAPSAAATVERHAPAEPRPAPAPAVGLGGAAAVAQAAPAAPVNGAGAEERVTMIREESHQVGEARDALRRGEATVALAQLQQIQARFPEGVLGQEREALTIEALARSGRRAEASARAAAFLQAHPTSVLAGRVQPFVQ